MFLTADQWNDAFFCVCKHFSCKMQRKSGNPYGLPDMPCMKRVYITMTNRRRYTGQQPGTKSGHCAADKPVVNGEIVHTSVYIRVPSFVFLGACPGGFSSTVWE